jgi:hypothetical protein
MRVFAVATMLLLSSSLVPVLAQNEPEAVPVQPERTPSNRIRVVSEIGSGPRMLRLVAIGELAPRRVLQLSLRRPS